MWRGQPVFAVIPCRLGSKRIPQKNLQKLGDRSLIHRAYDFVSKSSIIDHFVISTENVQFANIFPPSDIHLTEPGYLHSDECSGIDVWKDAWKAEVGDFPYSVYLEPSSPIREEADVVACLQALERSVTAATISETPKKFCPEKTISHYHRKLTFLCGDGPIQRHKITRRYYHLNGVCYASRSIVALDHFFENCAGVLTDHPTVNIDDPADLELARALLEFGEVR